jgi:hypothetical protein
VVLEERVVVERAAMKEPLAVLLEGWMKEPVEGLAVSPGEKLSKKECKLTSVGLGRQLR